ncbi:MAG: hypothetical protein MJY85_00715 [Fibrobacter sp.]|nr:hypothetical protein [Fibrobacter sp.]
MKTANYNSMSDAKLLATIRKNDTHGFARKAFLARYAAKINAAAKILAYKVNFDYSMPFEERKNEALSEAYILVDELIKSHDCRRAGFMTNFGLRLKWRLLTMQREYCESHGVSLPFKDQNFDYDQSKYDEREYFIREACLRLSVVLPKGSVELDTFNALAKAFHDEEAHPYEVAAKAMGCSRQTVYNRCKSLVNMLPGSMAAEIRKLLWDENITAFAVPYCNVA